MDDGTPPRREHRTPAVFRLWTLLLLTVLTGLTGAYILWQMGLISPPAPPRVVAARGDLAEEERTLIELFNVVSPSVVNVTVHSSRRGALSTDLEGIPLGNGSGFVWDEVGHVVTNFHVIAAGDGVSVTLWDQSVWPAQVVGAYADKDLAVLRIRAPRERLRPLAIGTSSDLQVGQRALAIGNPFGLDQTLTTGIVSALGREITSRTGRIISNVVQTDAAINPGNSGGPLLDSAGRLIGVNTAIYSPSGAFSGIGFAIPVDEVRRVVPQLIEHGRVMRPSLGVRLLPDPLTRQLGATGVMILAVEPDTPAAAAGLRPTVRTPDGKLSVGDAIVGFDGEEIATTDDLLDALERRRPGERVRLTIVRDGREREVELMLGPPAP